MFPWPFSTELPSSATLTMAAFKQHAWLFWVLTLTAPVLARIPSMSDFTTAQINRGDAISQLNLLALNNTKAKIPRTGAVCSQDTLRTRREW